MAFSVFSHVALTAVSAVVPANKVCVEDELQYYGGNAAQAKRLSAVSGLHVRRVAEQGVTAADMCLKAAESLLDTHRVNRAEIGALLFVSHSPDYLLPASAAILQHKLGLSVECATLDMNVGCAGFVKGLWMACGLVASRAAGKVLLLVGDTPNRFLDPANRVTSPVFGDAGTAALVEYQEGAEPMSFLLGSNGSRYEALVIPGGGSRIPQCAQDTPESPFNAKIIDAKGNPWTLGGYGQIWMDGMAIYTFGVSVIPPHIKRHLALLGSDVAALDTLLLHQANKVIIDAIGKKVGIDPLKVPAAALHKYGNLGSSSIPALMCDHFADAHAVPRATTSRETVMLCGFGAGLAWGSCVLSLRQTHILPVQEYTAAEPVAARDAHIAYWHAKFAGEKE